MADKSQARVVAPINSLSSKSSDSTVGSNSSSKDQGKFPKKESITGLKSNAFEYLLKADKAYSVMDSCCKFSFLS